MQAKGGHKKDEKEISQGHNSLKHTHTHTERERERGGRECGRTSVNPSTTDNEMAHSAYK